MLAVSLTRFIFARHNERRRAASGTVSRRWTLNTWDAPARMRPYTYINVCTRVCDCKLPSQRIVQHYCLRKKYFLREPSRFTSVVYYEFEFNTDILTLSRGRREHRFSSGTGGGGVCVNFTETRARTLRWSKTLFDFDRNFWNTECTVARLSRVYAIFFHGAERLIKWMGKAWKAWRGDLYVWVDRVIGFREFIYLFRWTILFLGFYDVNCAYYFLIRSIMLGKVLQISCTVHVEKVFFSDSAVYFVMKWKGVLECIIWSAEKFCRCFFCL